MQGSILADRSAGPRTQPGRHRAAVPHIPLRHRTQERRPQLFELGGGGQEGAGIAARAPVRGLAMIDEGRRSLLIEAVRHLTDPVRRISRHLGHLIRRMPLCQQPEDVPVAPLGPLAGAAVALLQIVHAQVRR